MVKKQPDYYKTIPEKLWPEADTLVDYVTYAPFALPSCCPYCENRSFQKSFLIKDVIYYRCLYCDKRFNHLTNTYFSKSKKEFLELWPEFIKLRLAGHSLLHIAERMNISRKAASNRDRIMLQIMQDKYPTLYAWWEPHQFYDDGRLTPVVKQQAKDFQQWLEKLITQQTAACPKCGHVNKRRYIRTASKGRTRHRPCFICSHCEHNYNLLDGTEFVGLTHIDKWLDFTQLLVQGKHNIEIANEMELPRVAERWRIRFIKQMEKLNYQELVYWINWQLRCNKTMGIIKGKTRNH